MMFERGNGYRPDLKDPRRMNEKLAWRKLYQRIPFAPAISDKLAVREYVSQRAGPQYLRDLIAVYEDANAIDFDKLPNAFVAKANHASGFNVFVPDKASADLEAIRRKLHRFLMTRDYGKYKNEWWYSRIQPRIIIEPLLTDREWSPPVDYELYTFDGVVKVIALTFDRFGTIRKSHYTPDWQFMDLTALPTGPETPRPKHLDEIIEVAQALGRGIDYARMDLLCPNDERVIFGEVTLAPRAGWARFSMPETDLHLGSLWTRRPALDIGWGAD